MAFTTENRNVSDIFQRSAKYKVPRYQRDYVWNRVNWKELWNDVNDTLRMYKNDDIRMYNFNCITDTIVEVITTCNTYTLLTVHLL